MAVVVGTLVQTRALRGSVTSGAVSTSRWDEEIAIAAADTWFLGARAAFELFAPEPFGDRGPPRRRPGEPVPKDPPPEGPLKDPCLEYLAKCYDECGPGNVRQAVCDRATGSYECDCDVGPDPKIPNPFELARERPG